MQTYLDKQVLAVDRPTLAAALRAGADAAERAGRVIIEASADGAALSNDQLDAPSDEDTGIGEVRLVSAEPRALVRVTLLEAADTLEQVGPDHAAVAKMIHEGRLEDAMSELASLLDVWRAVQESVDKGSALIGLTLENVRLGDVGHVGQLVEQLAGRLEELKTALANQDWSTVADLIEFEMVEQAERWTALLRGLSEHLKENR